MAIYQECPQCKKRRSLKREICSCGFNLSINKKKIYWIEYYIEGKAKTERLGNLYKKEVEEIEFKRKQEIRQNKFIPKEKKIFLEEIFENYISYLKNKKSIYTRNVEFYLKRINDFFGYEIPLEKITKEKVQELQLFLLNNPGNIKKSFLSKTTVDRYIQCAKAAWNYSAKNIPNPFSEVKLFNIDNKIIRYLTPEEEKKILLNAKKISNLLFEIIFTAISTGLRKKNILTLRRQEVDFKNKIISIRQKRDKAHYIPMTEALASLLLNIPLNGTDFFWINPKTGKPFTDIKKSWNTLIKKTLGRPFRFHDLRHHTASKIITSCGNLKAVGQILGHTQSSTTERYSHLIPSYLRNVVETLELNPDEYTD